ncbi:type II toxin-antitoxin system VapC family toxin [Candidatus Parcubacteria bacterium]|nr:type II toxin-antitoxin system VapC family toxin [Patescibacteria group bacterium]MBU4380729.1 type II toxin-antitoxin system VapC family toxin [Patescibacteria group bacterium]MCG2689646.1 type II toxin-antitoxin system VapC family toxin [Candidatus Parcubacteria bacterium]
MKEKPGIKGKNLYLDSSIFIYHFENNKEFSPYTTTIFNVAEQENAVIGCSAILFSEITPPIFKTKNKEILAIYSSLDCSPLFLRIIDLTKEVALKAGSIRAEYGFSTPDSIHLASAVIGEFDVFITNDKDLLKFKEIPILPLTKVSLTFNIIRN